jgi:hypothetical protein
VSLYHEGYKLGLINMDKRRRGIEFDVFESENWAEEEWICGYADGVEDDLKVFGIWEGRIKHAV